MTTYHDLFKPADDDFQVGQQVTVLGWSDRHSYTVTARTAKVLTLQADENVWENGQIVRAERNELGYIRVARLTTKRGVTGWRSDGQTVVAGSHPYRDPSF
jgi:hypothetical protein